MPDPHFILLRAAIRLEDAARLLDGMMRSRNDDCDGELVKLIEGERESAGELRELAKGLNNGHQKRIGQHQRESIGCAQHRGREGLE